MKKSILVIDQGTTSSRVIIFNSEGVPLAQHNVEYTQIFPKEGWVEHNPEEIWGSVQTAQKVALQKAKLSLNDIACIGITNQRETTLVWDKNTGEPLYNAIVWQDRRTADICEKLKKAKLENKFKSKAGLVLDPYFSGTKLHWILKNVAKGKKQICFGTVDSFLMWRLSGGKIHATDTTNASRTLLMNLKTLKWDAELCKILEIPMDILPEIKPSIGEFGKTVEGIPISGVAGDQHAALFGQSCFEVGDAKCTYGTGSFMLLNTGNKPVASKSGCLSTVAWSWGNKATYALEGSAFICGAAVQWLRDGLGIISKSSEIEALAKTVDNNGGVQFVPALTGLGAPYWNPHARGVICGLTRGSQKGHLARATLEGMALQNVELLKAMEKDLKRKLKSLKVDGGASSNDLLMQIQADYLGVTCVRPKIVETTSMGAAFMAGLGVGIWKNLDEIKKIWAIDKEFESQLKGPERQKRLKLWQSAVQKA
ncbi:MAG: glycerol kinase GlpK [Oligoflexia bacterium]|nr:glycerol kinase GlpK [Oligoflexia bacterium]